MTGRQPTPLPLPRAEREELIALLEERWILPDGRRKRMRDMTIEEWTVATRPDPTPSRRGAPWLVKLPTNHGGTERRRPGES